MHTHTCITDVQKIMIWRENTKYFNSINAEEKILGFLWLYGTICTKDKTLIHTLKYRVEYFSSKQTLKNSKRILDVKFDFLNVF